MKIAILHCRKSSNVCTGAGCFKAYNNDLRSFAQYAGNRPELAAFFDCGGCDIDRMTDPGLTEKLERLTTEGVDKIHIGICMYKTCPHYEEIKQALKAHDLVWEEGTH